MNELLKQHRGKLWIAQAVAFVLLGVFLASWFNGGSGGAKVSAASATANSEAMQSKPSIWTCSMHPQIRRDGPDSCPICGMDLVPVKESAGGVRTVSISPVHGFPGGPLCNVFVSWRWQTIEQSQRKKKQRHK